MANVYNEIRKSIEAHPDSICLTYEDHDFTYRQVGDAAKRLGAKLLELAPGDSESDTNIGLFAPNLPGFVVGFFGTLAADKVTAPINFLLNPEEVMTIGMHGGFRIIIASGPLYEKVVEMTANLPISVLRAEDFLAPGPVPELPETTRGDDDTAVLMYTSGTTGTPKGVQLTHSNLLHNAADTTSAWSFCAEQNFVCVIPLFHSFGMLAMMLMPMLLGARVILLPQFLPQKLIEIFNTVPRCIFFGVAPMFQMLAIIAKTKGLKYPNLELCVTGAAALPAEVKEMFDAVTGVPLYQGYGLSEDSPVVSINLPGADRAGWGGKTIPNVTAQIWDESGNELPLGEVGEVVVRGKNVMKGYYKNPEATKAAISPDGWLHTGDLGLMDEEGFVQIKGRKKELIICAGENIYPSEIEDVLMRHPTVAEVAVIGIPHRTKGEEAKAYVVAAEGAEIDVKALKQWCTDKLAGFKVPAQFEVRESLPKNPTGKILKRVLEEELAAAT